MKWAEMTPRERDVLVADKVMDLAWPGDNFRPSTDISAAWEVVEKVGEQHFFLRHYERHIYVDKSLWTEGWYCSLKPHVFAEAPTAPEAICKVALKAVGVEIE